MVWLMSDLPHIFCDLRDRLIGDGWLSPDTYAKHYCDLGQFSAVYIFTISDVMLERSLIAYVGMSENLKGRITSHNILPELRLSQYVVMTWFQKHPVENLRMVEDGYIQNFDPPWNILGRKRGIEL